MTYVVKNNQTIDVNKLSFEQFYQTIQKYKAEYGIPNKVYSDEQVSIGKINSAKTVPTLQEKLRLHLLQRNFPSLRVAQWCCPQ